MPFILSANICSTRVKVVINHADFSQGNDGHFSQSIAYPVLAGSGTPVPDVKIRGFTSEEWHKAPVKIDTSQYNLNQGKFRMHTKIRRESSFYIQPGFIARPTVLDATSINLILPSSCVSSVNIHKCTFVPFFTSACHPQNVSNTWGTDSRRNSEDLRTKHTNSQQYRYRYQCSYLQASNSKS